MNSLRSRGGDLHEEVVRLITSDGSPYNKTHGTGRGDVDAKINYANALADLRSKDPEAVKWGKGQSPSKAKVNISSDSDVASSKTEKLVGAAADLAKHFGYSDKEVKEASERHIAAAGQRR
jgi:phosphopantothenoylcysteine synthetase/decarboxylase